MPQDLMDITAHPPLQEETQLYDRVKTQLEKLRRRQGSGLNYDDELISLRDQIAEARNEDLAPLVEQMYRAAALASKSAAAQNLPPDPRSPYFGHMRLREQGKLRDVMLGKRAFIDRDENIVIVDWRNAPVSQIFYRYEEGDDYEEQIAGREVEGIVEARRTVSIQNSTLRRVSTPAGSYVRKLDGAWKFFASEETQLSGGQRSALRPTDKPRRGKSSKNLGVNDDAVVRADKHLPEIAALIDPQQFAFMTRQRKGVMVLDGGAGSGKTTVALHRIAYLNYQDPQRYRSKHMLVIVPQPGLVEYVSLVLPGLEVEKVRVSTLRDWARHTRRRMMPRSRYRVTDEIDERVARVKKHPVMLELIDALVQKQQDALLEKLSRLADKIPAVEPIRAAFAGGLKHSLARAIDEARLRARQSATLAHDAVKQLIRQASEQCDDVISDWGELCTNTEALYTAMAKWPDSPSDEDIRATVSQTLQQLEDPRELAAKYDHDSLVGSDGRKEDTGLAGLLAPCDEALILRLWQLKHGGLSSQGGKPIQYDLITVDEAQDFSLIELTVLLNAARDKSLTLAGDMAQRVVFDTAFNSWDKLLQALGSDSNSVARLELAYRSTREIMALAHHVLGPLAPKNPPMCARQGVVPEFFQFADAGEVVAFLAEALRSLMGRERAASVAVLARFSSQADMYYQALKKAEVPRLRRAHGGDFIFSPGVDVTDVISAKGLEFDYVVLVDVDQSSYPKRLETRHLLHVAVTRAVHQLWICAASPASPLLPDWLLD